MTTPAEVDEAYQQFFGPLSVDQLKTEWEELFLEWLIFDYRKLGGASFLIKYILQNPDHLDGKTMKQFEQIAQTQLYSMFEVQKIKRGEWFIVEDLHTGRTYQVYEKTGTLHIQSRGTIPGRIANVDGRLVPGRSEFGLLSNDLHEPIQAVHEGHEDRPLFSKRHRRTAESARPTISRAACTNDAATD